MRRSPGFSLIEILVVLMIVAILGSWALPTYRAYVNEAESAKVIANLHGITSAYHHAFLAGLISDNNLDEFKSPAFGQAPPAFKDLGKLYQGPEGITISTQVVNHSGYFKHATDDHLPVAFIHGPRAILDAIDGVTGGEHTFINDQLLLISLADLGVTHTMEAVSSALMQNQPAQVTSAVPEHQDKPPATQPAVDPPDTQTQTQTQTTGDGTDEAATQITSASTTPQTSNQGTTTSTTPQPVTHPLVSADSCPQWPPGHRRQCLRRLGLL